jgi:hypothetical protein
MEWIKQRRPQPPSPLLRKRRRRQRQEGQHQTRGGRGQEVEGSMQQPARKYKRGGGGCGKEDKRTKDGKG